MGASSLHKVLGRVAFLSAVWLSGSTTLGQGVAPPPVFERLYDPAEVADEPLFGRGRDDGEALPALDAAPYGGPCCERPVLTGDWHCWREDLRDCGYTLDVSSTNFYQGVTSGGLDREFRFGGRGDLYLNIDGERALGQEGLFVTLHGETLYGDSANGLTGAGVPISYAQIFPIDDSPVTALTSVTFTQFLSENLLVYFGKINTLDDYNRAFRGNARGVDGFMNGSLLFPPVVGRTIPYSTLAGGVVVLREFEPVLSVNVYDTNNTPTTTGFESFFDNGATIYAEGTLPTSFWGLPGHQTVGGAYSSGNYAALDRLPYYLIQVILGLAPPLPQTQGSWALVYQFDQALWADDEGRSWGLFGSAGISDGNPNPIEWSADVGLGGASPLPCRERDTFGIGYFYLGLSDDLRQFGPVPLPLRDEHGVELFYNIGVTPWFQLSPDLQIVTPVRSRVETSVNFALRVKIDF
jgi:porin